MIDLGDAGVLYDPDLYGWVAILDYNSFTVEAGATVRFINRESRPPVVIRSVGPIVIAGTLVLDGEDGHAADVIPYQAEPGPGGYRGGLGRAGIALASHSPGHGPGGGLTEPSAGPMFEGGAGSHGTLGVQGGVSGAVGSRYGSPLGFPLVGGSGGAGANYVGGAGGGAGGGAILIGSDVSVDLSGMVSARGGGQGEETSGPGSGGAIRVASPVITWTGGGLHLSTRGGVGSDGNGGDGRIRLESDEDASAIGCQPQPTVGPLGDFLPPALPSVQVSAWWSEPMEAWIPIGSDPNADLSDGKLADAELPASGFQTLRIEGRNVPLGAPLQVRLNYVGGGTTEAVIDSSHTVGEVMGSDFGLSWTDVAIDFSAGLGTVQVRAELP